MCFYSVLLLATVRPSKCFTRNTPPRLSGFLARHLERDDLIEEVCNDVMLAIWQHAGRFKRASRLSTWIFGIARYKALYAKRRSATRDAASAAPEVIAEEAIDWDHPETITLRRERFRALASAVESLPQKQRLIMTLVASEGLSYQEVATSTGCSVNTVKTRMFYARRRLSASRHLSALRQSTPPTPQPYDTHLRPHP